MRGMRDRLARLGLVLILTACASDGAKTGNGSDATPTARDAQPSLFDLGRPLLDGTSTLRRASRSTCTTGGSPTSRRAAAAAVPVLGAGRARVAVVPGAADGRGAGAPRLPDAAGGWDADAHRRARLRRRRRPGVGPDRPGLQRQDGVARGPVRGGRVHHREHGARDRDGDGRPPPAARRPGASFSRRRRSTPR